jgi:signal transduction histidine kinase
VRSSMTCPLQVDGRNVAVLFRSCRRPNVYDEHQLKLHLAIAEQLSAAIDKAYRIDQLNAAKHAYLDMLEFVSPELRGPLTGIMLTAELLTKGYVGELKPKQHEQVGRVVHQAEHMLTLIQQYLDLAQIENDDLVPHWDRGADFQECLLRPAVAIVRPQLEAKGMALQLDVPAEPVTIDCDSELLKIVLVNLLSNAIKYGDRRGRIDVRWNRADEGFELSVRNEGPGFPPEERSRLFRKFSRLRTAALQGRKGSGIGLYHVWHIVRLHGGKVWAESEPGRWAEFAFRIPQLPSTECTPQMSEDS